MILKDLLEVLCPEDKISVLHYHTMSNLFEGKAYKAKADIAKYGNYPIEYMSIQEDASLLVLINGKIREF